MLTQSSRYVQGSASARTIEKCEVVVRCTVTSLPRERASLSVVAAMAECHVLVLALAFVTGISRIQAQAQHPSISACPEAFNEPSVSGEKVVSNDSS
ncbi:hypothetical protein J6590_010420 [Homalodisca vitripennis]|nr:hypothetical protein J6590_010420 [Homalodisca vitripennis]